MRVLVQLSIKDYLHVWNVLEQVRMCRNVSECILPIPAMPCPFACHQLYHSLHLTRLDSIEKETLILFVENPQKKLSFKQNIFLVAFEGPAKSCKNG